MWKKAKTRPTAARPTSRRKKVAKKKPKKKSSRKVSTRVTTSLDRPVHLRLPVEIYDGLEKLAVLNQTSVSWHVRLAVVRYLKAQKKKGARR